MSFRGYALGLMFWLVLPSAIVGPSLRASEAAAPATVETWSDGRLTLTRGLVVWLDASRQPAAREAAGLPALANEKPVDRWLDGSGQKRDLLQPRAEAQPLYAPSETFPALRFSGQGSHLRRSSEALHFPELTVFVVAAPYSCPEWFSAFVSMSALGQNDFQTGFNLDQAVASPQQVGVVNIEGAGAAGMRNLLQESRPYGAVLRLCATSRPGQDGTTLWLDGRRQGARDRAAGSVIHLDELVIGARYYTLGGPPEPRGFLHGDIAEVLIFDRVLDAREKATVDQYLTDKYGAIKPMPVPGATGAGVPLVRVDNPPPVQVFAPGFSVRQLPLELSNINNVLYRADGKLVALGYDGHVWLLSDTDGDGLEDHAARYWENAGQIRAPIGMDLTPPGFRHGAGVLVASKGRCTLLVDSDGNDVADREVIVAEGWKELPHGVDALGIALDRRDGSVYFGLGTQNFTNAYGVDPSGAATYDVRGERGAILRVSPDFKSRAIFATGMRFPVGLRFNATGDLFATDQEGATWLANGNPFDELLHVVQGRHYGFPPRHPRHLPDVIDEPSTFDYAPQHQSTCGLVFNEPCKPGGPIFGPVQWRGDAFVTGYSRGKLYRTQLAKTPHGYVARSTLLASLSWLPADACVAPDGSLLVACHSGGPDWGSGPTGQGRLYKLRYSDPDHPQPVLAWPAGPREMRIEFDRPVEASLLADLARRTQITAGKYVRAGDRFEALWPGYAVVQQQQRAARIPIRVHSAQLTPDRRTIVLATDPLRAAVHYAVTLPGLRRPALDPAPPGELPQHPAIDLDFDLSGASATWSAGGQTIWTGWLPSLDLAVARRWTAGSAHHDRLWQAMQTPGELSFTVQLDLVDMLRPAVQPGAKLDYAFPPEVVTLRYESSATVAVRAEGSTPEAAATGDAKPAPGLVRGAISVRPQRGSTQPIEFRIKTEQAAPPAFSLRYSTHEDARPRPLALARSLVPWADTKADLGRPQLQAAPPEIAGGSWARGRRIFFSEAVGCGKCHAVQGQGGGIGPDLSNLVHRDYASVMRDIARPSFAINPDYVASTVILQDGRILAGVVRTVGDRLHIGDATGKLSIVAHHEVDTIEPARLSVMPEKLLEKLTPEEQRDLFAFLLALAPAMPRDYAGDTRPEPRTKAAVNAILAGAPHPPEPTKPLRIVLVAGKKDHGPGEHDYPAWLDAWGELLAAGAKVEIAKAMEWPEKEAFAQSDVMVFYQRGNWDAGRAAEIDAFLKRGGGLVYIHWAVDGQKDPAGFAERIGLAWGGGARFRHGPVELEFAADSQHPVLRNFDRLKLVDESYWNLTGKLPPERVLATAVEDKAPRPLFWSLEPGRGRVFVSIPGHYSWTFDDPLFRIILLRAIAWSAHEPVDRFNDLVWPGADVAK